MFPQSILRRSTQTLIGLTALAAALLATLCAPGAAKADTVGGGTFTLALPTGPTSTVGSGGVTINAGGSGSPIICNTVNPMNVALPTDLQAPAGAVWEYWRGEQVANPTITAAAVYGASGDPYVTGGTPVAWSSLFARNVTTGATYWWTGTAWSSSFWYQPFNHYAGNTYAIHDWVYFGMSNGTYTQWINLGFRSSRAYQGTNHVFTVPECAY